MKQFFSRNICVKTFEYEVDILLGLGTMSLGDWCATF